MPKVSAPPETDVTPSPPRAWAGYGFAPPYRQNGHVTTASLRLAHDAVVRLDYGQFSLCGSFGRSGDYMGYLEDALAGEGIAGDAYGVVVCSPHQNNFEMPFRVEVCGIVSRQGTRRSGRRSFFAAWWSMMEVSATSRPP